MATSTYKFTNAFADGTTRILNIGSFDTASIDPNIKQKIRDFNNETTRNQLYPNFDNAFISENGARFTAIKAAEIVTSQRTYFY